MAQTFKFNCERCGTSFTSDQPDARFCSNLCHSLIGNERKKYSEQRLDNPCTIRVSLLGEVQALISDKRKGI